MAFTEYLVNEIGVVRFRDRVFTQYSRDGAKQVRFAFCKRDETLDEAAQRLRKLRV